MARLFTYGDVRNVPKQNEGYLPGENATSWGWPLKAVGIKPKDTTIEYGEIVELTTNGINALGRYNIDRVDDASTKFGVVIRTTDGGINMEGEWIEAPRAKTPISIYPLDSTNAMAFAVPVVSGQTPVVGEAVYVQNTGDSAGAVRVNDTGGTAITGWVFASAKYKPTRGAGECVIISRAV